MSSRDREVQVPDQRFMIVAVPECEAPQAHITTQVGDGCGVARLKRLRVANRAENIVALLSSAGRGLNERTHIDDQTHSPQQHRDERLGRDQCPQAELATDHLICPNRQDDAEPQRQTDRRNECQPLVRHREVRLGRRHVGSSHRPFLERGLLPRGRLDGLHRRQGLGDRGRESGHGRVCLFLPDHPRGQHSQADERCQ